MMGVWAAKMGVCAAVMGVWGVGGWHKVYLPDPFSKPFRIYLGIKIIINLQPCTSASLWPRSSDLSMPLRGKRRSRRDMQISKRRIGKH